MDEDNLFCDEQEVIAKALALLALDDQENVPWRSHYEKLLRKYRKLVTQSRRLVKMGDFMQKELLRAHEATEFQATHDFLTRLWNRAAIMDTLCREIIRHERENRPLSFIMTDIDHFKHVNDEYGHLAGDEILREAARRLVSNVRQYDSVGRFGGEEFAIVVPGSDEQGAGGVAERIRLAFDDSPMIAGETSVHVTLSLGVATLHAGISSDLESIVRAADTALYRAKNTGRNRVVVFGP